MERLFRLTKQKLDFQNAKVEITMDQSSFRTHKLRFHSDFLSSVVEKLRVFEGQRSTLTINPVL